MDFGLAEDQREIQRTARELLAERARPERVREHAEAGSADVALWRELCELGWPGITIAERYGGQGLGAVELGILCEELGRTLAPVPFLPTALAATVIEHAGSETQRERWLPALAGGETHGAVGLARNGVAELVIGAPEAGVLVLVEDDGARRGARLLEPQEVELLPVAAIDPTRPAARVSAAVGAGEELRDESSAGTLPESSAAAGAPPGASTAGESLPGGLAAAVDRALVAIASELVGVCDRALGMTVAYVKERRQFGVPVGSFQGVSHRCAQMLLDTERARCTTAFAAWTADAEPERLAEAAAMAMASACEASREVTASAIQAHGGIGFTWEADLHWLYKRAQLDAALLGGAGHHRARLAAVLAAPTRQRLQDAQRR
jgi:alkylation response protein AidB-like acyl-CoA dehydrogenase